MNTTRVMSANRSLQIALTLVIGSCLIQSGLATDDYASGKFGKAPESLDYVSTLDHQAVAKQYGEAAPSLQSPASKKLARSKLKSNKRVAQSR